MQREKFTVETVEHELDLEEHLPLLEKGWVIQRVGWVVIILIMVAGALGLFGNGLLSTQKTVSGDVSAEYERFWRYETEMRVLVQSPSHVSSISFTQEYLKEFRIVRFVPESVNNNTTVNEVRYNFLPAENHIVSVYVIPKGIGRIAGTLKVNEVNHLNLNHFIYP